MKRSALYFISSKKRVTWSEKQTRMVFAAAFLCWWRTALVKTRGKDADVT